MSALVYAGSLFIGLSLIALAGVALWLAVEGAWYIVAKVTGREY